MKYFNILLAAIFISLMYSCGGPEGNKAEAGDAKEAKEASSEAAVYNVDLKESVVSWVGSKPLGEHNGSIAIKEGSLKVLNGEIAGGEFVIDINSIICLDLKDTAMNQKLVGHLKSADFFDAANFPEGKFVIVEVKKSDKQDGGITHIITGNLTLKDITKSVSFGATLNVSESMVSADAPQFVIDRTEWKVNYGSKKIFENLKDKFINDDMGIKISLKAAK